jgi:hypothetical protein
MSRIHAVSRRADATDRRGRASGEAEAVTSHHFRSPPPDPPPSSNSESASPAARARAQSRHGRVCGSSPSLVLVVHGREIGTERRRRKRPSSTLALNLPLPRTTTECWFRSSTAVSQCSLSIYASHHLHYRHPHPCSET